MCEVTPWLISWPATSSSTSWRNVRYPSPYVMQKHESSQKAFSYLVPKCTRE